MTSFRDVKKFIKSCAAPYANNSPFSTPREQELKNAHEKCNLLLFTNDGTYLDGQLPDDPIEVAIIARKLTRKLSMKDFAQRDFTLELDTVWITDFHVGRDVRLGFDYMQNILHTIKEWYYPYAGVAVEVYAENFALVNALMLCGFHKAFTKISAFAEVKAVYTRPIRRFISDPVENINIKIVKPDFLSDSENGYVISDLDGVLRHGWHFANHYSIYNKDNRWSGLAIRGFDSNDASFIEKPTEMSRRWRLENPGKLSWRCSDTVISRWFKYTLELLRSKLSDNLERVRILRLLPGGEILRHCDIQDKEAGLADGKIARFHIPLRTNSTVFTSWDADGVATRLEMPLNSLCYLDHRKPHAVVNGSDKERLHLIVDVYSDERIRTLLRGY